MRQSRYKNTPSFLALIDIIPAWRSSANISINRAEKSPEHNLQGAEFQVLPLLLNLKVRLPLHGVWPYRRLLNFAHVSVVYSGHLPIVLGDHDRIPTRFGDNAAISALAAPINASALL